MAVDAPILAGSDQDKSCSWVAENIWVPLSDWWNTKTVSVNPELFLGLPDSVTYIQITSCDHSSGNLVTAAGKPKEHYSLQSIAYVPPM